MSDRLATIGGGAVVIGFVHVLPGWLLFQFGGWPALIVFGVHLAVGALVSHWLDK